MLKSVGGVQVSVANGKVKSVNPMILPAADVLDPAKSALAKLMSHLQEQWATPCR